MRSRRWTRAATLVSALGLAGCSVLGSSAVRPPDYLSHAPGDPQPRTCRYLDDPGDLPPFTILARPGTRGSLTLVAADMPATDTVELSARYDETGRLEWVRAIRSSVSPDRSAPLEELLLAELRADGPADWGFRMYVVGGDIVGLAPSVRCPAEVRSGSQSMVSTPVADQRLRYRGVRGRPYRAWISLDEHGRVTRVRTDATSGHRISDGFVTQYILQLTFAPQLHDGVPVATTLRETIYIPDTAY